MKLPSLAAAGLLLTATAAVPQAHAVALHWTLSDVVFSSGATAFGSFDYDADTDTYSNINVTDTGDSDFAGANYTEPLVIPGISPGSLHALTQPLPDYTGTPELAMTFNDALTDAGGTEPIFRIYDETCLDAACSTAEIDRHERFHGDAVVTASTPADVPEPASIGLLGAATIGLSWFRRRRA